MQCNQVQSKTVVLRLCTSSALGWKLRVLLSFKGEEEEEEEEREEDDDDYSAVHSSRKSLEVLREVKRGITYLCSSFSCSTSPIF